MGVRGAERCGARTRAGVVLATFLVGCSGTRELKLPLRPDEVNADERRAFECFTRQLPSLLREFDELDRPDHAPQPWDSYDADPANQRYYVRDDGDRVRFLVVTNPPPPIPANGIGWVCADGCGAFLVSYAKDAKACDAHPVETGGKRGRM